MVTERVQIRTPWLLRGYGAGCQGYQEGTGKSAMVTKRVQGSAPWLLKGYTGKSAMATEGA